MLYVVCCLLIILQEVIELENLNKHLKNKVRHLQTERDTLHSLIRKHLPKCVGHPEIETSNIEKDTADKTAREEPEGNNEENKSANVAEVTWTMSHPSETVNYVDSMREASESSQISQVKNQFTNGAANHADTSTKEGISTTFSDQPVWPGMMVQAPPSQLPQNIPFQDGVIPDAKGNFVWPGVSHFTASAMAARGDQTIETQSAGTPNPPNTSIPDVDQPLVIDLSADRFSKTGSQENDAVKAESPSTHTSTKIIGHYFIQ